MGEAVCCFGGEMGLNVNVGERADVCVSVCVYVS